MLTQCESRDQILAEKSEVCSEGEKERMHREGGGERNEGPKKPLPPTASSLSFREAGPCGSRLRATCPILDGENGTQETSPGPDKEQILEPHASLGLAPPALK